MNKVVAIVTQPDQIFNVIVFSVFIYMMYGKDTYIVSFA